VNVKKVLTWVGIAFVVFFVLSQPRDAGGVVKQGFGAIESIGNQLASFVKSLAQ
jgi:hypothetical protein